MAPSANVHLTDPGGSTVNRLRLPEFGVLKLCVKKTKSSKCCLPDDSPVAPPIGGSDDFHFAPEKEAVTIEYEIDDPLGVIDQAELQLQTRFEAHPLWTLDLTPLGRDWYAHGKHEVEWKGELPAQPTAEQAGEPSAGGMKHKLTALAPKAIENVFPDGYVTVEHSPYKLRLLVSSGGVGGNPTTAWTYFQILVKKIELEYGEDKMLPAPVPDKGDHRKVLADLKTQNGGKPPAKDGTVKVHLESNLFKTDSSRMMDNTLYEKYEALWGDGPRIPLLALVHISDSDDNAVLAPKALGNVKFLWDWENKSEDRTDNFVTQSQKYYKDETKPKGLNAHKERGGKRADDDKRVLPVEAGYAPKDALDDGTFPFKVEACPEPRKWAVYSTAWRDKLLASKTGVIFHPSRMAGDVWQVTCYLAWDRDRLGKVALNVDKDAPLKADDAIKAVSGKFEVWRKAQMRKLVRKRAAGMPALNLGTICGCFDRAFFKVDDVAGAPENYDAATWNNEIANGIAGWNDFEKLLLVPATGTQNQHAAGPEGLRIRTRTQYLNACRRKAINDALTSMSIDAGVIGAIVGPASTATSAADAGNASDAAAAATYNAVDMATIRAEVEFHWTDHTNWLNDPANGYDTRSAHATTVHGKAIDLLIEIFDKKFTYGDGVYIFQVEKPHNLVDLQDDGYTLGQAHDFASATEQRCAFLLMCPAGAVPCGVDKISAHEIGHHFFLPHPPDTAECEQGHTNYLAHDEAGSPATDKWSTPWSTCLMSYNYSTAMELCGFCQLRLRGWDKSKLDPDGAKNTKP